MPNWQSDDIAAAVLYLICRHFHAMEVDRDINISRDKGAVLSRNHSRSSLRSGSGSTKYSGKSVALTAVKSATDYRQTLLSKLSRNMWGEFDDDALETEFLVQHNV